MGMGSGSAGGGSRELQRRSSAGSRRHARSRAHDRSFARVSAPLAAVAAAFILTATATATAGLAIATPAFADPTPQQALSELNSWRAQLGEAGATTINPDWNTGCQDHNQYEQDNGTLTHFENSSNPGYTTQGAKAGPDSVLAEQESSSAPSDASLLPGPVWDGAVFHRAALLKPRLNTIGFASTTFPPSSSNGFYTSWVCLWDQTGASANDTPPSAFDDNRTTAAPTLYPSPGNGATKVPTTFTDNESPDPHQESGVPAGTTLGWLLNVEINGPWSDAGGGGIAWAHDVSATLEPDGTSKTVPVVISECGSDSCADSGSGTTAEGRYFEGGFGIFPLQPLAANTTYHVQVSGTVSDRSTQTQIDTPVSLSWCFSTGSTYTTSSDCSASSTAGPEPAAAPSNPNPNPNPNPGTNSFPLNLSVTSGGSVTGGGLDCPGSCSASYPSGTTVKLTAKPRSGFAFTGWSGACSGTATTCTVTLNRAATVSAGFAPLNSPAAVPTLRNPALAIFSNGLQFAFTTAAAAGSTLTTNTLALPRGLSFTRNRRMLARSISVTNAAGKRIAFSASVRGGTLVLRPKTPSGAIRIKLSRTAFTESRALARKLRAHAVHALTFTVTATDSRGRTSRFTITFHLR